MQKDQTQDGLAVCYVSLPQVTGDLLNSLLHSLPDDEQEHAAQLRRPEDQLAFAAGRTLVRRMLSVYAVPPATGWRFERTRFGKPTLARSSGEPDLRFNLSHTQGMVVAVTAVARDVGVDAAFLNERVDLQGIADMYFSNEEAHLLRKQAADQQRETFFALWTLKEAYLKARGEGLSQSRAACAFTLEPLSMQLPKQAATRVEDWFLWRARLLPLHCVAVAAQTKPGECLRCRPLCVLLDDLLDREARRSEATPRE